MGLFVAFVVLLAFVLAVVALNRAAEIERNAADQAQALRSLERHVQALEADLRRLAAAQTPGRAAAAETSKASEEKSSEPQAVVKPATAPRPPVAPKPPVLPSPMPPAAPKPPVSPEARPAPERRVPAAPEPPLAPVPPAPPSGFERPARAFDWEDLVGVKLFSWVAAILLTLGAVFFLRYSIQAGWLQPPIRMAIGIVVGLALLAGCELRVARNYPVTANALDAAGIVILFSTFFAAFARWHLVPAGAAFLFLILVTTVAVLLSIRRDSLFIAVLGLVGGFLTPALLSTGQDNPVGLFGYLLVLNAGLDWVAYRKRWALLTAASLVLTTIYQWSWVGTFLTPEKLPLATGIFLVFPVLGFVALALARRTRTDGAMDATFSSTASIGGVLPLLFACFVAAVPAYGAHAGLLFGFVLCIDAGLFSVSLADLAPGFRAPASPGMRNQAQQPDLLHLIGAFATNIVLLYYLASSYTSAAWPGVLGFVALFVAFYLAAPLLARLAGRPLAGLACYGPYASAALLFAFPMLVVLEPATAAPALIFAVLFALVGAIAAFSLSRFPAAPSAAGFAGGSAGLHLVAAFFALVTEAVWSASYLTEARLLPALFVYLAFALFYIGVPVLALALPTLGGHAWNNARSDGANPTVQNGAYLGLAGHLLLLFVAGQPALSIPPWPMLAVLLLLDLAVGAAALYTGQAGLHLSALGASALVLLAWLSHAVAAPWPGVALAAAAALAALAVAWMPLARAAGRDAAFVTRADAGGALGLVLAQVVAMIAAAVADAPAVGILAPVCVLFAGGLFAVAAFRRWLWLAVLAVVPYALTVASWRSAHSEPASWLSLVSLAGAIYAAFLAFPLLLGRRAGRSAGPYRAAVLASAVFFFAARHGLTLGGFGDVIGILPISQALLMTMLLRNLLRIEPPGARNAGRLALVAGAGLAFVTVAIPLQLEKEWITIGWALEGTALAWLSRRIPHRGLLWTATALLAAAFVRLSLNPAVFVYEPRGAYALWNWYLYTYLTSAGALLMSARLLRGTDDSLRTVPLLPWARSFAASGGTVLLFLLLNIEIADVYSTGPSITFNLAGTLAQDLTYTLGWGVFAVALLGAGIATRSRPARFAALALLVVSVLKGFLHDLARLGGLYRVASLVGLAICLALVALALQKFVLRPHERKAHESIR